MSIYAGAFQSWDVGKFVKLYDLSGLMNQAIGLHMFHSSAEMQRRYLNTSTLSQAQMMCAKELCTAGRHQDRIAKLLSLVETALLSMPISGDRRLRTASWQVHSLFFLHQTVKCCHLSMTRHAIRFMKIISSVAFVLYQSRADTCQRFSENSC